MPEYDNTDKFTLWYNAVEEGSKKPVYTSGNKESFTLSLSDELRAHVAAGGDLEFAAWGFETRNGNRGLSVKASKPYVAAGAAGSTSDF